MKVKRVLFFILVASALYSIACGSTGASVLPDIGGRPAERDIRYPVRKFLVEVEMQWQDHKRADIYPGNGVVAAKFDADFLIRSFAFHMPTVYENMENSVVLTLYKWNDTYKTTINGDPIVVITRKNIRNNETVVFEIDEGVAPPGTYLWTLSDGKTKNPDACVAIWSANPNPDIVIAKNTVFYLDGFETTEFLHKTIISGIREEKIQPAKESEE